MIIFVSTSATPFPSSLRACGRNLLCMHVEDMSEKSEHSDVDHVDWKSAFRTFFMRVGNPLSQCLYIRIKIPLFRHIECAVEIRHSNICFVLKSHFSDILHVLCKSAHTTLQVEKRKSDDQRSHVRKALLPLRMCVCVRASVLPESKKEVTLLSVCPRPLSSSFHACVCWYFHACVWASMNA